MRSDPRSRISIMLQHDIIDQQNASGSLDLERECKWAVHQYDDSVHLEDVAPVPPEGRPNHWHQGTGCDSISLWALTSAPSSSSQRLAAARGEASPSSEPANGTASGAPAGDRPPAPSSAATQLLQPQAELSLQLRCSMRPCGSRASQHRCCIWAACCPPSCVLCRFSNLQRVRDEARTCRCVTPRRP